MIPDELRALMEPRMHKLVMVRRGVYLVVCAGCEMEYIYRLAQLRNAITMELNAIPAGDDDGARAGLPGDRERSLKAFAEQTPVPRDGDGEDVFDDGGEDDQAGPEIGGGMECEGPAVTVIAMTLEERDALGQG